jgi:hypothetical protein
VPSTLKSAANGFDKEFVSQQEAIWVVKERAVKVSGMIIGKEGAPGAAARYIETPFQKGSVLDAGKLRQA